MSGVVENQEAHIAIGEVYFDEQLADVFKKDDFVREVKTMSKEIDVYLGENKSPSIYEFRIYSQKGAYEEYFKTHFPEKLENFMENDMVFYHDERSGKNVIAKFMERIILDQDDSNVRAYLSKKGITFEELELWSRQNYRDNIYPTVAHELTHAHSFFKGINYRDLGNKWAQEMVCVFIDQKMWEKYSSGFGEMIKDKARKQAGSKDFYWEIMKDFKEGDFQIEEWERLWYGFLEKEYGKRSLRDFWVALFESEHRDDIERCFEIVFGGNLKGVIGSFQEELRREG